MLGAVFQKIRIFAVGAAIILIFSACFLPVDIDLDASIPHDKVFDLKVRDPRIELNYYITAANSGEIAYKDPKEISMTQPGQIRISIRECFDEEGNSQLASTAGFSSPKFFCKGVEIIPATSLNPVTFTFNVGHGTGYDLDTSGETEITFFISMESEFTYTNSAGVTHTIPCNTEIIIDYKEQ